MRPQRTSDEPLAGLLAPKKTCRGLSRVRIPVPGFLEAADHAARHRRVVGRVSDVVCRRPLRPPRHPPLSTPSPPPPPPLSTPYTPLTPLSIDRTGRAHSRRAIGPRRESGGVRDGTPHSPSSASWSADSGDPNGPQDRLGGSLAPPPNRRRGTGGGPDGYRLRRECGGARGSLGLAGGE